MLSQLGSIWCLAIPVLITFWICLPRAELAEAPPEKLNLPRTDWWQIQKVSETKTPDNSTIKQSRSITRIASVAADKSESDPASIADEIPAVATAPSVVANTPDNGASLKSSVAEPKALAGNGLPPENEKQESAQSNTPNRQPDLLDGTGVVVADAKLMNLNPVAVFDPLQNAAKDEAKKQESAKTTVRQAEEFGKSATEPEKVDSDAALAAIEEQARKNREQISDDVTLKPLIAMHEAQQAKQKAIEFQEALKRRAESNRGPFLKKLGTIVDQSASAAERIEAINNLIQDDLGPIDPRIFQPVLAKLEMPGRTISTASKIRLLRSQNIPESIILSYLIQLEMRDLGKTNGPRNAVDAKLQSARLLLRIPN